MSQQQPTPETMIRTMQIIALAMPAGVILFAVVAVLALGALDQAPGGMFLSLFAVGFTALMFAAHLVLPGLIAGKAIANQTMLPADLRPYGVYQARTIIKLAMLEGAAFLNVIAAINEHNWWSLGIAGLLVGWMLTNVPTRSRVDSWIATQGMGTSE